MPTRPRATALQTELALPGADGNATATPLKFTPVAHIIGHGAEDVHMMVEIMENVGIEYKIFENSAQLVRGWSRRIPDIIIIDVAGGGADAVDTIFALAEQKYTGAVQLTHDRGNVVIEGIARVAERAGLNSLPVLSRPFDQNTLKKLLDDQKSTALQSGPSKIRLEEGLKNNWVDFWYQPKLNLRTRTLVGVESLVRMFHPQIGLVPPSVFLQDANETSLFILGQRALVHAVKTASNFSDLGLNLTVAINVSVKALRTLPVSRIIQTNHVNKARPLQLTLDVNESDVAADPSFFAQRVKLLRTLGVNLAIDDFQSDRLSQNDLRNMAPAELKIPRMFVAGSDGKSVEAMICQSIIDVAHKLAAHAVAIGIERASQLKALEEMGCDLGQGFLFGQSMPSDQIVAFTRRRAVAAK